MFEMGMEEKEQFDARAHLTILHRSMIKDFKIENSQMIVQGKVAHFYFLFGIELDI